MADRNEIEKYVREQYKDILGRSSPDRGGVDYWVNAISAGNVSKDALGSTLAEAAKDWEKTSPGVYRKQVTPERTVVSGSGRDRTEQTVAATYEYSQDDTSINFADYSMENPDTPGSPAENISVSQFENFVRGQYKEQFGRAFPETDGVNYWTDKLTSGTATLAEVASQMRTAGQQWENTGAGEWTNRNTGQVAYDETPPPSGDDLEEPEDFDIQEWLENLSKYLMKPQETVFDKTTPVQAASLGAPVVGAGRESDRSLRSSAKTRFKINLNSGNTGARI